MQLHEVTGQKPDYRQYCPSDQFVLPSCRVGVEVELENLTVGPPPLSPYWQTVEDGSLRNNGYEMRFLEPLFGQDVSGALSELEEACLALPTLPDCSQRTSVHVHLDVRDMDSEQLIKLLLLYFVFEKALLHYHNNSRDNNIFCLPFHKAESVVHALAEVLHALRKEEKGAARTTLGKLQKYSALNVGAVTKQGSVEFRHMAGSYDAAAITEWINIIQSLKKTAMSTTVDCLALPEEMSIQGPNRFLYSVFGQELGEKLLYDEITNDMFFGVRLGQDALYQEDLYECQDSFFETEDKELSDLMLSKVEDKEYAINLIKENF